MDGKVLVLCSEKPTVNQYGERIDKNGYLLEKTKKGEWINNKGEIVKVDEHKRIINGMDMTLPIIPESIGHSVSDIIFANWESIMPSDIELLQRMVECSRTKDEIPLQITLDYEKNRSLMAKAHLDRLNSIDKAGLRPSIDYKFQAMDDFMRLFSETLEKEGVVTVVPTFSKADSEEIINARRNVITTWRDNNKMLSQIEGKAPIELADTVIGDFVEVYKAGQNAFMEVMAKPFFFEGNDHTGDDSR